MGLGINHQTVGWGTKKSFQYGFSSNIIKYKTILSSKFNSVSENEKIIRPQNEFWLDNKFYANYRYLKTLNPNWSYGIDLMRCYSIRNNYKNNLNTPNLNYNISTRLSKKLNKNLYGNFDIIYSNKLNISNRSINYNQINEEFYSKSLTQIKFSIGLTDFFHKEQEIKETLGFEDLINNRIKIIRNQLLFHPYY